MVSYGIVENTRIAVLIMVQEDEGSNIKGYFFSKIENYVSFLLNLKIK